MRVATARIKEMASHSADALVLGIYLSEPMRGFDGCLTEDEYDRASRWVEMLEARGIAAWEERT